MMPETAKSKQRTDFYLPLLTAMALAAASLHADEPSFSMMDKAPVRTVLTEPQEFDRGTLMAPEYQSQGSVSGFSFLNPNRFSMRQSYSVNFASGSYGSSSNGLYLNTLSYKLADPLTLSADVGFHTPLYNSTGSFARGGVPQKAGFQDPRLGSSLVLPRVGLEYKPSKSTTVSLQLLNGPDAYKAYGSSMDPFVSPWSR
jgi:hypothetical protein